MGQNGGLDPLDDPEIGATLDGSSDNDFGERPMVMTDTTVGATSDTATQSQPDAAEVTDPPTEATDALLPEGAKVEVRSTLDQRWSGGFVVISAGPEGYRLRRGIDDTELPSRVPVDHVRRERKRGTWWM